MPHFFFNDLSVSNWIAGTSALKGKLSELCAFHALVRSHAMPVYLHKKGLYDSRVCGVPFREAVQTLCDKEQTHQVLGTIDKSVPSLPEDSAIPGGCRFLYEGAPISTTGLSECAYWIFMGEDGRAYSLSGSSFSRTPLPVTLEAERERHCLSINNFHSLESLESFLAEQTPPPATWDGLLALAGRLEYVYFEPYVSKALQKETFSAPIADAVHRRLKALNDMAGSASEEAFRELERKYCHGDRAWFSDESETRIHQLRNKLTFNVQGESVLCSYHGKVSIGSFRIHLDSRPQFPARPGFGNR